jgi:hypothetical protein
LARYPLIVSPTIKDFKLNRVLIDEGCSLNILFVKTFNQMGLPRLALWPSWALFHGIVPDAAVTLIDQITLPVTFETRENFHTEYIQFNVADFETTYNAFLGRPTLTKFMAILHYAYFVLKMSGPNGVISVRGGVKRAYVCDQESCEMTDALLVFAELQDLKKVMVGSPWT